MSDTTDPRYWSKKIASEGITTSFLRPTGGGKAGILERGFWPGDRPTFRPQSSRSGLIFKLKHLLSGTNSESNLGGSNLGGSDLSGVMPWTWFNPSYFRMPSRSLLKNIDLRTRRGGPSTVPRPDQGKNIWALYNFAQKTQHFGNLEDTPKWFQRPGFVDRGSDYERPGFIQSFF
jgi:hypothetical protein